MSERRDQDYLSNIREAILSVVMFCAFIFVLIPVNESPSAQRVNE